MTTREVVDIDSCEDDDDDDDDDENNKGGYQSHNNYYNENDDDDMRALHTFGTPIGGGGDGDDDHDGSMSSSSSSSYHRQYHSHESKRLNNSNSNDGDDHYYSSTSHDDDEDDRHHVVMTKTTDHRNYNHHNNDAVLLFENSSNDDDDDNNACHFTDDGWNTVRQRLDDQMEQTRLATLPPTPHQLQMAEELAKNSANKKQKDYINIKIKKPTLKKQSSKNNSRRGRQQDGGGGNGNNSSRKLGWSSGSDDDGILLNSPKGVIGGGGGDGSISSSSNKGGIRRKKLTLAKFRSTRSGMSSVSGVSTLGSGDERCPTEEGDNQTRNSLSASGTFINTLAQEFKEKTKIGGGSSSAGGGQSYHRNDSQQQQQWSLSGPPSNTVSVRCGRDSATSNSNSFDQSTTTRTPVMTIPPRHGHTVHSNMFRPLLLIQSNRRAHKGSIYVMKFSPHGGHFLATGGEDTRVCIWQVAPDVKTTTSTTDNHDSEGSPTKGMRMDGGGSPERFVAGAREQEEAAEHAISQYRTTAESLVDEGTKQTPHFDKDILTHEGGSMPLGTDIHLLSKEPYVVFEGHHTAEIVDLAWSQQPPPFVRSSKKKKQKRRHEPFLLTASLDKMILLWHMSRPLAPLHKFAHADMVTCVDFHPTDDSLFVSGGFDSKLRLWSIADGRVKSYAQCLDIITSAKFTPDSNMIVAGLMKGQVFFYLSNSMTYYTQIDSKNRRGKNSEGCKVTGIEFFTSNTTSTSTTTAPTNSIQQQQQKRQSPSSSPTATNKKRKDYMLVTTNDSRLRIFDLDDAFRQIQKCKGLKNTQMQIKSHFCQSGQFIICGSETGSVYIWENEHEQEQQRSNQNAGTTSKENSNDSSFLSEGKAASGGGGGTSAFMSKLKVKKGGAPTVGNILSSTSTAYASFDGCPRRRAVAVSQQQLSGSGSSIPNVIGGGSIMSGGESTITGNGIATVIQQGAVTDAIFVPSESVLDSITKSELFSSTLQTCEQIIHRLPNEDFSSSMMVAGDNEGSLRIFLRRSCFDSIIRASGPAGSPHNK